jgi:hypothetical protein
VERGRREGDPIGWVGGVVGRVSMVLVVERWWLKVVCGGGGWCGGRDAGSSFSMSIVVSSCPRSQCKVSPLSSTQPVSFLLVQLRVCAA